MNEADKEAETGETESSADVLIQLGSGIVS
jgi:hypothetical protein